MQGRTIFRAALASACLLTPLALNSARLARAADDEKPVVVLDTTAGPITLELDQAKAPISVANFLKYVDKGFYDGVVFHRVIPGFMIQTGGMKEEKETLIEKRNEALPPIKNESGNGLSNGRGTIAMARTDDPDSATSQFFINLKDNPRLNDLGGGYTVFGKVVAGMDVVDTIAKAETTTKADARGDRHPNVPVTPVVVKTAKRKSKS